MPVTVPEEEPTVAIGMFRLLHTPPVGVAPKVMEDPTQISGGRPVDPPNILGERFTVTVVVAKQPVGNV